MTETGPIDIITYVLEIGYVLRITYVLGITCVLGITYVLEITYVLGILYPRLTVPLCIWQFYGICKNPTILI